MELYHLAALQGFGGEDTDTTSKLHEGDKQNGTVVVKIDAHSKAKFYQDRAFIGGLKDITEEREIIATAAVAFLLLCQNLYFCYRTTVDAAQAYEEVSLV